MVAVRRLCHAGEAFESGVGLYWDVSPFFKGDRTVCLPFVFFASLLYSKMGKAERVTDRDGITPLTVPGRGIEPPTTRGIQRFGLRVCHPMDCAISRLS